MPRPRTLALTILVLLTLQAPARATSPNDFDCRKQIMAIAVHFVSTGLGNLLKTIPDQAQQTLAIRKFMEENFFYDDLSGYMFVYDLSGENIAHADKSLQGVSLLTLADGKGADIHKKFLEAVRRGGGFLKYRFPKPGKRGDLDKVSYVEMIPGTNYFIGSGVYQF